MLSLINVNKSFADKEVLHEINYNFKEKGLYLLKGISGSGKSTLLRIISKRIDDFEGEVIRGGKVFHLEFDNYLLEGYSVKENIALHEDIFKIKFKRIKALNIEKLLSKKIEQLSIGERQRVGLYLAINSDAKIVLLDEPFAGVSNAYQDIFSKLINKLSKNKLVIVATHNSLCLEGINLTLVEGRLTSNLAKKVVAQKQIEGISLAHSFRWVLMLHLKQIISRIFFILMLVSSLYEYQFLKRDLVKGRESFDSFLDNKMLAYKKKDKLLLKKENYYDLVVSSLLNETFEYSIDLYSEEMYKANVSVRNNEIGNGFLFSKTNIDIHLKSDEIIVFTNLNRFCLKNHIAYCYHNQIREKLIGNRLVYEYASYNYNFIIKDIVNSDNEMVYVASQNIKNELDEWYEENSYVLYNLSIYNNKLKSFYTKINSNDVLINFDFNLVNSDDEVSYFLVSDSEYAYFKEEEIGNSIVCSKVGVSCSLFEYLKFESLVSIDNVELKEKVGYMKYEGELGYQEIVISSSLSKLIKKSIGDRINLTFYYDGEGHALDDVKIVDVIANDDNYIYHTKYDYYLFKDKFDTHLRVNYLISNDKKYLSRELLNYELIRESKLQLEYVFKIISIIVNLSFAMLYVALFFVEGGKTKKHHQFYALLTNNNVSIKKIVDAYYGMYFLFGFILVFNLYLFAIYEITACAFYILQKRKIKSRMTWI